MNEANLENETLIMQLLFSFVHHICVLKPPNMFSNILGPKRLYVRMQSLICPDGTPLIAPVWTPDGTIWTNADDLDTNQKNYNNEDNNADNNEYNNEDTDEETDRMDECSGETITGFSGFINEPGQEWRHAIYDKQVELNIDPGRKPREHDNVY
jgi:hypothetical protein